MKKIISTCVVFILGALSAYGQDMGTSPFGGVTPSSSNNSKLVHTWQIPRVLETSGSYPEGYTYLYNATIPLSGVANCDLAFQEMDNALEANLFDNVTLLGTSFMYCGEDSQQHPVELDVQAGAEPLSASAVKTFQDYLGRVQGRKVLGSEIHYAKVERVIARTDLQATIASQSLPIPQIFYHVPKYDMFTTLAAYYAYQEDNHSQFWKPMNDFLQWVEAGWGAGARITFINYALPQANSVTLDYERNYLMEDQSLVKNWLVEISLFRDCSGNSNKKCL